MSSSPPLEIAGKAHSTNHVLVAENRPKRDTFGLALQTCMNIAERVIFFCLLCPVILPPSPTESRRSLAQTCQLWREIILLTAVYWENVVFAAGPFKSVDKLVGMSQQALQRSGTRPLHLDFTGYPLELLENMAVQSDSVLKQLIYGRGLLSIMRSIVLPNKLRVRSLRFVVCSREDFEEVLNIRGHQFPQLEVLDVAIPPSLGNEFIASVNRRSRKFKKGLYKFPHIKRFSLRLLNQNTSFLPYDIPQTRWNKLTDLNIKSFTISPNVLTDILRQASLSLTRASFCIEFAPATQSSDSALPILPDLGLVSMPFLFCLDLTLHNTSKDTRLFDILHLPALKYLWINNVDEYATTCDLTIFLNTISSIDALEAFQVTHASPQSENSTSQIPASDIPQISASYEMTDRLFKGLHNLRALTLPHGMHLRFNIMSKIACGEFLPRLMQLKLTVADDWDQIAAMIHERNAVARLCSGASESSSFASPHRHPFPLTYVHISLPESILRKREDILQNITYLPVWISLEKIGDDIPSHFV